MADFENVVVNGTAEQLQKIFNAESYSAQNMNQYGIKKAGFLSFQQASSNSEDDIIDLFPHLAKKDNESRTEYGILEFSASPDLAPVLLKGIKDGIDESDAATVRQVNQIKAHENSVLYTKQELIEEEKSQARANIGAMQNGVADTNLDMQRHGIDNASHIILSKKLEVEGADVYAAFEMSCGSTGDVHGFAEFSDINGNPVRITGVADGTTDSDAATCGQLWDAIGETEQKANRVTAIDETADDEHYPTAKAVVDYVRQNGGGGAISHCWQGKKIVFLGDSIAQGYTNSGNVSNPYPKVVANNLGMTLTNYGIGGSTVAQQGNYGGAFASQEDFEAAEKDTSKIYQVITGQTAKTYKYHTSISDWAEYSVNVRTPLSARWSFMRNDADLIVVHGGTNDFQYNWTPVGAMADRTPYTFYGALHTMLAGLIEKYKGKTIVFMTPLKRAQTPYFTPESKNDNSLTLSEYRDIMLEVCDYYGIPVIDVFSVSGLNPYLESQADLFDDVKTHPLQWGHNRLGDTVSTKLLSIQRFNSANYVPNEPEPDEPEEPEEPTEIVWYENRALSTGSMGDDYTVTLNCRTTSDFVPVPTSGLTITLTNDDFEMCVYAFGADKKLTQKMDAYLTTRTYSVDASAAYARVMIRSKSQPNSVLITAEQAAAGVQFTAT